jgi:hypothetical protein
MDSILYPVVVTLVLTTAAVPLSLVFSGTLSLVKWALFLAGFPVLTAGCWKLRPSARWQDRKSRLEIENTRGEGKFQKVVDNIPPLRGHQLRNDNRTSDGFKLALTGLLMLIISYLLEALLGVPG